ncbi:hypothetical protein BH10PLA1_BH10PLA1_15120 [soil metagenome]
MRPRWIKFDWSISTVIAFALHVALVWWMLRDRIRILEGQLARGFSHRSWVLDQKEEDDRDELGQADGTGTAIAPSAGEQWAAGQEADMDQPLLSRDPVGHGRIGDAPSQYTGITGDGPMSRAMQQSAGEQAVAMRPPESLEPSVEITPPRQASPLAPIDDPTARASDSANPPKTNEPAADTRVAQAKDSTPDAAPSAEPAKSKPTKAMKGDASDKPSLDPAAIAMISPTPVIKPSQQEEHPGTDDALSLTKPAAAKSPLPRNEDSQPSKDSPTAPAPAPESPAQPQPSPGANSAAAASAAASPARHPGMPMPSADPAPQSDSEIDLFTKVPSVEFRAGKTTVRAGRQAHLTRPRIPLVGFWDSIAMGRTSITLQITIDDKGKVVRADIKKSSGSNEIDNPIALEAYNWWFEPYKNDAGEPIKFTFPFDVVFR